MSTLGFWPIIYAPKNGPWTLYSASEAWTLLNHPNIEGSGAMWPIFRVVQNTKVHLGTLLSVVFVLPIVPRNRKEWPKWILYKIRSAPTWMWTIYIWNLLEAYIISIHLGTASKPKEHFFLLVSIWRWLLKKKSPKSMATVDLSHARALWA